MAPYEALYMARKTPLCWEEIGVESFHGPSLVSDTSKKVKQVQHKLKIAKSRQKSYADNRRRELEFQVGDMV